MRKDRPICLKEIKIPMSNREPYSLQAIYDKEMFDEKGRLLNKREEFTREFIFRKVTAKELLKLRLEGKPGAVYKKEGQFYYTEIPGDLKILRVSGSENSHLCGENCTNVCKDCPRTKDLTASFQERDGKVFPYTVMASWRIEKYDFVDEGLEAFNMEHQNDAFVVLSCQNYKMSGPRLLKTNRSVADLKLGIAQFFWEDFDGTLKDMRDRINAQKTG